MGFVQGRGEERDGRVYGVLVAVEACVVEATVCVADAEREGGVIGCVSLCK